MSGHNKWQQIKHQKGATDQKRAKVFSKLLRVITIAARDEQNPDFNPRLRSAIEQAVQAQVPKDNIERAIKRAGETVGQLDELTLEAYGPGGAALIIEAATDNKNRTIPEVKKVLNDHNGKWGETGSVRWAFESSAEGGWTAKFSQELSDGDKKTLSFLVEALENHDDVQNVFTNAV